MQHSWNLWARGKADCASVLLRSWIWGVPDLESFRRLSEPLVIHQYLQGQTWFSANKEKHPPGLSCVHPLCIPMAGSCSSCSIKFCCDPAKQGLILDAWQIGKWNNPSGGLRGIIILPILSSQQLCYQLQKYLAASKHFHGECWWDIGVTARSCRLSLALPLDSSFTLNLFVILKLGDIFL